MTEDPSLGKSKNSLSSCENIQENLVQSSKSPKFFLRPLSGLKDISASLWNQFLETGIPLSTEPLPKKVGMPFLSWEFLQALEISECVSHKTGWAPCHILLEDKFQNILAGMPLYLKNHSYGEYVFDQEWDQASKQLNCQPYYPKLQTSVPFTPVTGARFLTHKESEIQALVSGALSIANQTGASSWHITFPEKKEYSFLKGLGFLQRIGIQFHFKNKAYQDFESFLTQCKSKKRKMIRKERKIAQSHLTFKRISGKEITSYHMELMYEFYQGTCERRWGHVYLNRHFFKLIHQRLHDNIILVFALEKEEIIAGAFYFYDQSTLYGRYWGTKQHKPFLHFELCCYQAIDIAIEKGLKTINAGAQGNHKLLRGFEPVKTYSAHWIADDKLRNIVYPFLEQERKAVQHQVKDLKKHLPYHSTFLSE